MELNGKEPQKPSLRADVVGLLGAVTLGIVMLSPAMTLYGSFGPTFMAAGKAAPLVFFWALIATIPTAISYSLLSRSFPNCGSAASWIARTGYRRSARWAGWMVFLYYLANFTIQPITLGVFLNDLLRNLGFSPNLFTFVLGALLCCAWPAWIVFRGVAPSVHGALGFLLFETLVVTALCLTVLRIAPEHGLWLSVEGFHFSASPDGASGIFRGLVFGMLAFCGFDVISTLGAESKMPRRLIPQATFIALLIYGFLVISGVWLLTYAATPAQLRVIADAGGMPVSEIARLLWGRGALLVPITAISAALGISIATAVGASRVLLSMSKNGDAPAAFGQVHPKYQAPWNAMTLIFITGFVVTCVTGSLLGPYETFVWWATASTFFAMLTYLIVNLANLLLFRHEILRSPLGFALHGVVPVLGLALDGYILIQSFFIELWKQGWNTGQSVIAFDLICAGVAAGFAFKSKANHT